MKVTAIMATCGRHLCSERSLSLFLRQTYKNSHLLIYQNSDVYQELDGSVDNTRVSVVNNHLNLSTHQPYDNLGTIYNDALRYVPADTDIIIFWDDDDLFLQTHIEYGVNGLIKGNKTAYKPSRSYFRADTRTIVKVENRLEPSIFVEARHIYKYGCSETTADQHFRWLEPLLETDDIYIDPEGESTLIYNWGDPASMYKTSADGKNPKNFSNYRRMSRQHGDRMISPIDIERFYSDILSTIMKSDKTPA